MSLKLGNTNINKVYLGSTEMNKLYLGTQVLCQIFPEKYLEIDIETTDGQPFEITFEDGNTVEWQSGQRLTYGYSSTYDQLEVTAFSANVNSISLINNVAIDLSSIANLTQLETFTDQFSKGSTITGSINNFNSNVISRVHIVNSVIVINGDIQHLAGANYIRLQGNQITVTGNIQHLAGANFIYFNGRQITVTGDIQHLAGANYIYFIGNQITVTGNIQNLAGTSTVFFIGNQITVTGDIQHLAGVNTVYFIGNQITVTGDIQHLAGARTVYFSGSQITVTGDIQHLSGTRTVFFSGNQITVTGNIQHLSGANYVYFSGNQITVTGDIQHLAGVNYIRFSGNQIELEYNTTAWSNVPSSHISLLGQQTGLTTTEVDNLFIDLSNATTIPTSGSRIIQVIGNNAAPTAASLAARNTLINAGYTITTN